MTWKIKAEKCETCIFNPGNPMKLRSGRVREMVRECEANDSFVVCHDTLDQVTGEGKDNEAACRGYIEAGHYPQMMRIAERLNMMEEV